jgi:hypothetical protein
MSVHLTNLLAQTINCNDGDLGRQDHPKLALLNRSNILRKAS